MVVGGSICPQVEDIRSTAPKITHRQRRIVSHSPSTQVSFTLESRGRRKTKFPIHDHLEGVSFTGVVGDETAARTNVASLRSRKVLSAGCANVFRLMCYIIARGLIG